MLRSLLPPSRLNLDPTTMPKSLRSRILAKEITIGSWLSFGYAYSAEIMARGGFDWMVIDLEHGAIDMGEARSLIQIIDLAGCVPLVRVASNDSVRIKQALDAGARGVIIPMVNTADEARSAVRAAYYPPVGARGVGLARAQDYGADFEGYRSRAADETIVIVQIEHIEAVKNLEQILAVPGVDGFMVGPYDLSGSVGHPGDFNHPAVREAMAEVARVAKSASKPAGYHIVQPDTKLLKQKIEEGFSLIAYGDDMVFFREKVAAEFDGARKVLGRGTR
jgi:2-keto-3-deoxy-L-rhamnonate aldolase RhmA